MVGVGIVGMVGVGKKAKIMAGLRTGESAARTLQRNFRLKLSRQAVAQARRLLVDEMLLWRLAAVLARTEARMVRLVQWRWRAVRRSREFQSRVAVKRIGRAVVSRQARRVAHELERLAQREQAELVAAIRLQAALRRHVARRQAERAARNRAVGQLRAQFSANREERAIGRVQRAWVASVARRREAEARGQAATAELLTLRLARARASELRTKHFAALVARHLRLFVQRRIRMSEALRGWLSKRVQPGSLAPPGRRWRRRFFWVAGGALLYDSVRWRSVHARAIPIRELSEAKRAGPCEFHLKFGAAGRSLTLRSLNAGDAEFWRRSLLWLAKLIEAPPSTPLANAHPPPSLVVRAADGGDRDAAKPMPLVTALKSLEAQASHPPALAAEAVRSSMQRTSQRVDTAGPSSSTFECASSATPAPDGVSAHPSAPAADSISAVRDATVLAAVQPKAETAPMRPLPQKAFPLVKRQPRGKANLSSEHGAQMGAPRAHPAVRGPSNGPSQPHPPKRGPPRLHP